MAMALAIIAGFLVARYTVPLLPLRDGKRPRLQYWHRFNLPKKPEYFFFNPVGDELSQSILYHDLGASIDNARKADIIFIGNSRLNLGLRGDVIVPAAKKLGLRVFSLGCGFGEAHRFPMAVIDKFNLHPKVLVVVGGPWYYRNRISKPGLEAMRMSRWDAIKKRIEAVPRFYFTYYLHQFLPRFDIYTKRLYPLSFKFRSARTGFWKILREPPGKIPVRLAPERPSYDYVVKSARRMKEDLDKRGTLMVTTVVPFIRTRIGHLKAIRDVLGVPFVLPSFDHLTTSDGSHLNTASAELYAHRFWAKFIALPQVRKRLGLGPMTRTPLK